MGERCPDCGLDQLLVSIDLERLVWTYPGAMTAETSRGADMGESGASGGDLDSLPTEAWAAELADLDLRGTAEQVALANVLDAQVPAIVAGASAQVALAVDATVERLSSGGRL